jgi:isoquinoline 1-oxidoreductase beta subunit
MTTTRREFLAQAAAQSVALLVTIPLVGCRTVATGTPLDVTQWISVDGTGLVTFVLDKAEMGQGVTTSLPMIMAEELGAEYAAVRVVAAKPGPQFTEMGTSGSGSVIDAWNTHRRAAATVRTMLVSVAATRWGVAAETCYTEGGFVRHRASSRRIRFGELVADARTLPVPEARALKDPADYRLLGTRVADPEIGAIVRGEMAYGIDARLPGMRFAAIARCPVPGGTLRRFDAAPAMAVEGVLRVVEVPSGVAVVASNTWAAFKGRDALTIEWAEGRNVSFDDRAAWRMLTAALDRGGKVARRSGDARARLARATRRLDAEYHWPFQAHAAIEPLSALADVRDSGCRIWAGMQSPNGAQRRVAEALGIDQAQVEVNVMRLGGGFGRRIASDFIVEAALVSRAIAAPVQVVWSREDDFRHDMYNPAQLNRLSAALGADGQIEAWWHRVGDFHLSMFGAFDASADPAASGDPWGGIDSPYDVDDLRVELAVVESPIPTGAWRAVTYPAAVMARECFLDEIAHATRQDPLALRLSLIPSPGTVQRGSISLPNGDRLRNVLRLAADRAGWGAALASPDPARRVGRGIACNQYHRGTMVAQVAEVSVGAAGDIRVHRLVSAVDGGQIVNRAGVEKQFEGGVGWALSALFGPGVRFERGRTVGRGFGEFPVLRTAQMPRLETHIVDSSIRPFGMGEPPVPAVIPAVLNAVFAATGNRIRRLPLPPVAG